jgi:hypothetical protein
LPNELWTLLLETADRLGVKVRVEKLEQTPGGLCRLKGQDFVFIDKNMDIRARARCLALNLRQLDLEQIYIKPKLRGYLEQLEEQSEQS